MFLTEHDDELVKSIKSNFKARKKSKEKKNSNKIFTQNITTQQSIGVYGGALASFSFSSSLMQMVKKLKTSKNVIWVKVCAAGKILDNFISSLVQGFTSTMVIW